MGYCISQNKSSFKIKGSNQAKALEALKKQARNMSYYGTREIQESKTLKEAMDVCMWSLTIENNSNKNVLSLEDVSTVLSNLLKESRDNNVDKLYIESTLETVIEKLPKDADVIGICFEGEKSSDEKYVFDLIAPYVEAGSYIEMCGEDGAVWRFIFDGKTCEEKHPKVEW